VTLRDGEEGRRKGCKREGGKLGPLRKDVNGQERSETRGRLSGGNYLAVRHARGGGNHHSSYVGSQLYPAKCRTEESAKLEYFLRRNKVSARGEESK